MSYRFAGNGIEYAAFRTSDGGYWQWIAGGGEDAETPAEAARREAFEEAGISPGSEFIVLDSKSTIPVVGIRGFLWGPDVLVVPEHCFGVMVDEDLLISSEHSEFAWMEYESAYAALCWDGNRNALWELNHRLTCGDLIGARQSPFDYRLSTMD